MQNNEQVKRSAKSSFAITHSVILRDILVSSAYRRAPIEPLEQHQIRQKFNTEKGLEDESEEIEEDHKNLQFPNNRKREQDLRAFNPLPSLRRAPVSVPGLM